MMQEIASTATRRSETAVPTIKTKPTVAIILAHLYSYWLKQIKRDHGLKNSKLINQKVFF